MKILFSYVFKIYKFLFCYKDLAEKSKIVEEKNDKVVDFLINHEIHRPKFKLFKRSFHLSIHTNFPKTGIINNSFNVLKSNICSDIPENIKIKLLYVISIHMYEISKTIDTDIQLTSFLVDLSNIKI